MMAVNVYADEDVTVTGGSNVNLSKNGYAYGLDPITVSSGSTVYILASVPEDKVFNGWSLTGATGSVPENTNPSSFVVGNNDVTVDVVLRDANLYTVTPGNNVSISSDGQNYSGTALQIYEGQPVYIKADVPSGSQFYKWKLNGPSAEGPDNTAESIFKVVGNVTVNAVFKNEGDFEVSYYSRNVYYNEDGTVNHVDKKLELGNEVPSKIELSSLETTISPLAKEEGYSFEKAKVYYYDTTKTDEHGDVLPDIAEGPHQRHLMMMFGSPGYYFADLVTDRDVSVLVEFGYEKQLEPGYYKIEFGGDAADQCEATYEGATVYKATVDQEITISAPATLTDGSVFAYWRGIGMEGHDPNVTDLTSNETTAKIGANKTRFVAVYKPASSKTVTLVSEDLFDGVVYGTPNVRMKIGGVEPVGEGVPDRRVDNGITYRLSKFQFTDKDGNVLKEYDVSGLPITATVDGYYNRYGDETIVPNDSDEIHYRKCYERRTGVGKSTDEILNSVTTSSSSVVDLPENTKIVANAESINLDSNETALVNEEIKNNQQAGKTASVTKTYDLTLYAGFNKEGKDQSIQITVLSDPVPFTIYLTDEEAAELEKADSLKVVKIHDGESEMIDATYINKKLTLSSAEYSTYAIVSYKTPESGGGSSNSVYRLPKTGVE